MMKIIPASGTGAYVSDINLNALTDADTGKLRGALGEYGVLFFREQSISPTQHIELAQKFGKININRFFKPLEHYPQIAEVRKEPEQASNIGEQWHTDHSYDQIPALGSILVAQQLPATGGDTLFVSMFAAFNALSAELKQKITSLTATHSSRHVFGAKTFDKTENKDLVGRLGNTEAATQDAIHPVVIRHPISGKQGIYVNPDFTTHINELNSPESETLLNELYAHCKKPEFSHRFDWEAGSVAFWDNRATWHKALNDYPGQQRLMHRITIEGVALNA